MVSRSAVMLEAENKRRQRVQQHGLIDEYRIGLNPIVLGKGTPLFKPASGTFELRLAEARPLRSGVERLPGAPR